MTTIYVDKDTELPARKDFDLYRTERTLIKTALKTFLPTWNLLPDSILDIGAGDGRWGAAAASAYKHGYKHHVSTVCGVELRDERRPKGWFTQWYRNTNFLEWKIGRPFDLIVGNPPYGPTIDGAPQAEHFIRHAWEHLAQDGMMLLLLRLNMMCGVKRHNGLWRTHPPVEVAICSRRPSFYGGGTNATEYGVYCWKKSKTMSIWRRYKCNRVRRLLLEKI